MRVHKNGCCCVLKNPTLAFRRKATPPFQWWEDVTQTKNRGEKEERREVKAQYEPVQPQISATELSTSLQEMIASMAQISKNIAGLSRLIKWYALVQSSILVGILIIIIYFKLF